MIIGDYYSLMVHLDKAYIPNYHDDPLGSFSFNIDGKLYPHHCFRSAMELYHILDTMKENLEKWLATNPPDFTFSIDDIEQMEIDGHREQFDGSSDDKNFISSFYRYNDSLLRLSAYTELEDVMFCCYLGFRDNEDRFFYSLGFNEDKLHHVLREINYPRGTVVNLIRALPNANDLETVVEFESNNISRSYTRTKIKN